MLKLINPENRQNFFVYIMKEDSRLGKGSSFGEMALKNNQPRAATIICSKPCKFATILRRDFLVITTLARRRKLKEVCEYVRGFRIFEHMEPAFIEKLWQHVIKQKFIRGQTVYTNGKSETDGMYFVAEGEFEVSVQIEENSNFRKVDRVAKKALSGSLNEADTSL